MLIISLQFDYLKALMCLLNAEICKLKAIEREYETENERQEQKSLITEFTPFTGLHLRVPLQWVPIH
jgi:formate hydrogenlyase subunit 6/NADH:ubiquinone oxidoreductase subunit I